MMLSFRQRGYMQDKDSTSETTPQKTQLEIRIQAVNDDGMPLTEIAKRAKISTKTLTDVRNGKIRDSIADAIGTKGHRHIRGLTESITRLANFVGANPMQAVKEYGLPIDEVIEVRLGNMVRRTTTSNIQVEISFANIKDAIEFLSMIQERVEAHPGKPNITKAELG